MLTGDPGRSSDDPVLATIDATGQFARTPLGSSIGEMPTSFEMHILSVDDELRDLPHGAKVHTFGASGLPRQALRFGLSTDDLIAYALPSFLASLSSRLGAREILYVDPRCLATSEVHLAPLSGPALEIFPILPRSLARAKPDLSAAMDADLGRPSTRVLHLVGDPGIDEILAKWVVWIGERLLVDPAGSLSEDTQRFLAALPGSEPLVTWNHTEILASWWDLGSGVPPPPLVDTSGLADHRAVGDVSLGLIERRTHDGSVVEELLEHVPGRQDDEQSYRSGTRPSSVARTIFRSVDPLGTRWGDPFDDTGPESFRAWLDEPDSRGLRRFVQAVYWAREDLQRSFPPSTTEVQDLEHWVRNVGIDVQEPPRPAPQQKVTTRLVRTIARRTRRALGSNEPTISSAREPAGPGEPGVNVVGFARSESGLGQAMRFTLGALASVGVRAASLDLSHRIYSRRGAEPPHGEDVGTPYDLTVFHLNPVELIGYLTDSLAYRIAADRHIGFWAWETEKLPERWLPALDLVDEVWVPSTFVAHAVQAETDKPVVVMGHPVDPPDDLLPNRELFDLHPDAFVVGYITDAFSGVARKDPLAAIRAFDSAFGPHHEDAQLALKVSNLEKFPRLERELNDAARSVPVRIIPGYLSRLDIWRLLASMDVYLSLHASEGFGLTILEAMSVGVPVVATGYGGNLDYTDPSNALLVDFELVPASGGPGGIYGEGGRWARPDLDQAARHLQTLHGDPKLRRELGQAAAQKVRDFSPEAYAARISERLRVLGVEVPT